MVKRRDFPITDNFWLHELEVSSSNPSLVEGVPDALLPRAIELAVTDLQPIRDLTDTKIIIHSGYRPAKLNAAVGGSKTSQHMKAEAADIVSLGLTPKELFQKIRTHARAFNLGQVILYPTFVHIALPSARYPDATFFEVVGGELRWI